MASVTDDDFEHVRALVAAIPHAKVSTYGDLAATSDGKLGP